MRILFPLHSMERGGGCRVVAEAANGLVARGHHVMVALPQDAPLNWPLTAEVVRLPRLAAEVLPGADAILPTFYTTLPVALAAGMPIIRFCLGFEPLWVADPQTALDGYHYPHPILTISASLQEILLARAGRRSHLVHPGVDRAAFYPRGNKGLYGRPSVLFLLRGAGYSWKGTDLFWQAIAQVRRVCPEIKLLILANDEAPDPAIPWPHRVFRAPGDDEFARIVSAADIFVFPSLFEGFGLPPLEAMACGTAVIATDSGGVRDYAQHGLNCLLVPPGRVEPLVGAILRLLHDHELRRRICANGLNTAAAWPWYRLYDEMHQLIPALTGAGP